MHSEEKLKYPGKLVAIEGIDCSGKSLIIKNITQYLDGCKVPTMTCGELESPLADTIRKMLRDGATPFLKTFFFASDRAWVFEAECLPALERGDLVIWDRYVDSALVYRTVELSQAESMITMDFVRRINSPFPEADATVFIDISVPTSARRAAAAGRKEAYDEGFLSSVRSEYLNLGMKKQYIMIDGEQSIDLVRSEVVHAIKTNLKELFN